MLALKVTKFWSFYLRCIFPSKEPRAKWCHGLNNQFPDKITKFNAKEIGSSLFFGMEFSYQQKLELMFDEKNFKDQVFQQRMAVRKAGRQMKQSFFCCSPLRQPQHEFYIWQWASMNTIQNDDDEDVLSLNAQQTTTFSGLWGSFWNNYEGKVPKNKEIG